MNGPSEGSNWDDWDRRLESITSGIDEVEVHFDEVGEVNRRAWRRVHPCLEMGPRWGKGAQDKTEGRHG